MTTWVMIGNGWRNLFLLSCLLQALALGVLFAVHRFWMKENRVAAFLAGVAVTPFAQYLWMLALALLWPAAPKLVYIGVPPLAAGAYLLGLLLKTRGRWLSLLRGGRAALRRFRIGRATLLSICFAAAMGLLLLPVCIRTATSTVAAQADSGGYMGLALRYTETRDTAALFTKDDTQTDYRGNAHFPSLELYMSYGLMHTSAVYGYPYDKPMFTAVGILIFYLLAAFLALCLRVTNGKLRWVMLALLLFNLIPNFVYSIGGATRDTWRVLAVLLLALAFFDLRPAKGRRYLLTMLFAGLVSFAAMSAHVVCFVVVPFIVTAWVVLVFAEAVAKRDHPWRALLQSLGVAAAAAAGVLAGFAGNLWCYAKWGVLSPWRLIDTFTAAPWFDTYLRLDYRLEETTTSLNFWTARYDIVMAHASPVGLWGMRLSLLVLLAGIVWLVLRRRKRPADLAQAAPDMTLPAIALLTLFTLAPITGLLDTSFYSFSGTFIKLTRYTLQWYFLAAAAIAAVGAYAEAQWPALLAFAQKRLHRPACPAWVRRIPAWICVLLCVAWFYEGTKVTGYSASFFRYGRPWLTSDAYAQDNYLISHYQTLLEIDSLLTGDQTILAARESYQYPLHSKALVLTANPVVPLLNVPADDLPAALAAWHIAAVVTETGFWDDRFYAQTVLSDYLSALPAGRILESGGMRIYLVDADLAKRYHAAYDAT